MLALSTNSYCIWKYRPHFYRRMDTMLDKLAPKISFNMRIETQLTRDVMRGTQSSLKLLPRAITWLKSYHISRRKFLLNDVIFS